MNPSLVNGATAWTSVYSTTTDPEELLVGTRGQTPDGRVFYWTRNDSGATLTAGELLVSAAADANRELTTEASPAGQKVLNFAGGATAAADLYAEGFAVFMDGTHQGTGFKIRTHGAIAASAGQSVTLYDNLHEAITAVAASLSLITNPYTNPQQSNATIAEYAVGVPQVDIADGAWGWVQTWGPSPVLTQGTPAIGTGVVISETTAGSIGAPTTDDGDHHIGVMISTGVNGDHQLVDLKIRP